MSRKKRRSRGHKEYHRRPERQPDYRRRSRLIRVRSLPSNLTVVEDRREYHPRGLNREYRNIDGTPAKFHTVEIEPYKQPRVVGQTYFSDPNRVVVCKKRRKRRQILFAARKAGKGITGPKKRKYTEESQMRCK